MVNLTLMSATKCEVNYVQCLRLYIMLPMQGKDQHKFLYLTSNLVITRIERKRRF